jgi:hypothetical protein
MICIAIFGVIFPSWTKRQRAHYISKPSVTLIRDGWNVSEKGLLLKLTKLQTRSLAVFRELEFATSDGARVKYLLLSAKPLSDPLSQRGLLIHFHGILSK